MSGKIFFSRVRYAVIRPCGPMASVNRLAECRQPTLRAAFESAGQTIKLSWTRDVEGWLPEFTTDLSELSWALVSEPVIPEATQWVVRVPVGNRTRSFFRLKN